MAQPSWHFRAMNPAELNSNPMEREMFAEEAINERLVREAIQNSLDAAVARHPRSSDVPVRVRFSLRGVHEPLDATRAAAYTEGIVEHLQECLEADDDFRDSIAVRGLLAEGLPYLVIEDAGTIGLEGDWEQYDDSIHEPADDNQFYWFFRNVARSGKSGDEGGSWGLGKWVFPDASKASAYIAVTRRRQDGETLLMGQSVLTKHTLHASNGEGLQRFAPYGYFCEMPGEIQEPLRTSDVSHEPFIKQCIEDFDLRYRDEPGLSVVVLFPRTDGVPPLDKNRILTAVVHNYFYPILAGWLQVTVDDGGASEPTAVTGGTIDDVVAQLNLAGAGEQSADSYLNLFAMCRDWALHPEKNHTELSSPPRNDSSYSHFTDITSLQTRFEAGEVLPFRIWTKVQKKGSDSEEASSFRLYVQQDNSLAQGQDYYVRGFLSIPKMDEIRGHSARTFLVVDERDREQGVPEPLAAMLKDSEPPAHTIWSYASDRVNKHWRSVQRVLTEVRKAGNTLLTIWDSGPTELDKNALADLFPSSGEGERRRVGVTPGGKTTGRPVIDQPTSHKDFNVTRADAGFRVRFSQGVISPPKKVMLEVAYEVQRGNALKSYSQHDFRLHGDDSLEVEYEGCRLSPGRSGNELYFDVDDWHRFTVAVRGFDPQRDVHVKVVRVETAQESEGDE